MPDAQHVVHDLEALVFGRVIDGGDVRDLGVLGSRVVFEEGEDGNDTGRGDVDGQLVLPDRKPKSASGGVGVELEGRHTAGCTWAGKT